MLAQLSLCKIVPVVFDVTISLGPTYTILLTLV